MPWGNDDTEQLIKILKGYDVPATFFVVGAWVDKYPESVKQLSDAGHQIQNHSNTHPHMPQLSKTQIKNEIESCNQKIEAITGKCPTLLRPPYGDYDNALIEVMTELKMYTIQWDVELSATVGITHKYWGCECLNFQKKMKIYHKKSLLKFSRDFFTYG